MTWLANAISVLAMLFANAVSLAVSLHVLRIFVTKLREPEGRRLFVRGYIAIELLGLAFLVLATMGGSVSHEFSARALDLNLSEVQISILVVLGMLAFPVALGFGIAKLWAVFLGCRYWSSRDPSDESPSRTAVAAALFLIGFLLANTLRAWLEQTLSQTEAERLVEPINVTFLTLGYANFLYVAYFKPGISRWRQWSVEALAVAPLSDETAKHAGLRRARVGFHVLSQLLPPRLTREEFGDALERAEMLARSGARSWRVDRLWLSTVAVALGNTVRDLPRWLSEQGRSRRGRTGGTR